MKEKSHIVHLFNEKTERYNQLGKNYEDLIRDALRPIVHQAVKAEISLRDLQLMISNVASEAILMELF